MTAAPGGSGGGATMAAAAHYERAVQFEPSSSFDLVGYVAIFIGFSCFLSEKNTIIFLSLSLSPSFQPTHSAAIQGLRRPRGPRGRSLPSRYHGQQQLVI